MIPVVECPWPPGLPPASYSTRLRSTQFWDPRIVPSFPFPAPAPLGHGAQPSLARPPPLSFLLPPTLPPPSTQGPGKGRGLPLVWKGSHRHSQAQPGTARGKGELLCLCQQEVPVFSHSRTQAHSRVDSPGTVNKDTPLNTRGHSQIKKQTHSCAPTLFTPQQGTAVCVLRGRGPHVGGYKEKPKSPVSPSPGRSRHFSPPPLLFRPQHQEMPLVPWCQIHKTHTYPQTHTLRHSHSQLHRYTQTSSLRLRHLNIYTYPDTHTDTHLPLPCTATHTHLALRPWDGGSQHSLKATPHHSVSPLFQGALSTADPPSHHHFRPPGSQRDKGEQGSQAQGHRERQRCREHERQD